MFTLTEPYTNITTDTIPYIYMKYPHSNIHGYNYKHSTIHIYNYGITMHTQSYT